MVVSTVKQLESTYLLWKRFSFSTEKRSWDAVAVPAGVGDRLNSAFTVILSIILVQFWTIVLSLILYLALRRLNNDTSKLDPLAVVLWNKRGDLADSAIEMIGFDRKGWARPWLLVSLFLALVAGVAKIATTIVVAPLIILNHAAPVNPMAVYAPDENIMNNQITASRFALEAPRFFRALSSVEVDKTLRQKVIVSSAERLGQADNGEDILRVDYSYGATGADLGIQKYFDLTYNATGSCVTDYGWFQRSTQLPINPPATVDIYNTPNGLVNPSLFDGRQPSATFELGPPIRGALDGSNSTWWAIVSSVDRKSFSVGTDPWYLTEAGTNLDITGPQNVVRPGRPALSCWQDNVWSYHGHTSTSANLTSNALPGLNLPEPLQQILLQYLGSPIIALAGSRLQNSALLSTTTSLEQIFDAGASSFHADLERLVQVAYVATVNCLTDTTLYPSNAGGSVNNALIGNSGVVPADVRYVVWSPDVATLSTLILIVIPTIFVSIWLVSLGLVYWTPVKIVAQINSSSLQDQLKENSPMAVVPNEAEEAIKQAEIE
ncbi:hypothetical protein F5X97DRAFT_329327 [Nemania serpens]|nr:hypothetical protein F5X97DRAFT_329327 [Nemania serpens]